MQVHTGGSVTSSPKAGSKCNSIHTIADPYNHQNPLQTQISYVIFNTGMYHTNVPVILTYFALCANYCGVCNGLSSYKYLCRTSLSCPSPIPCSDWDTIEEKYIYSKSTDTTEISTTTLAPHLTHCVRRQRAC